MKILYNYHDFSNVSNQCILRHFGASMYNIALSIIKISSAVNSCIELITLDDIKLQLKIREPGLAQTHASDAWHRLSPAQKQRLDVLSFSFPEPLHTSFPPHTIVNFNSSPRAYRLSNMLLRLSLGLGIILLEG